MNRAAVARWTGRARTLLAALLLAGCAATPPATEPPPPAATPPDPLAALLGHPVDAVRVEKSKRRMLLLKQGHVYRSYRVALGKQPGPKRVAGDKRTPEGRYTIDGRNPRSDYYKALHISYPSESDRKLAKLMGKEPGGNIVIHGLPNGMEDAEVLLRGLDWTGGCIAVTNREMEEIWRLVRDGTPIEIRP